MHFRSYKKKMEIKTYLENKKLEFKETGNNQYVLQECPYCRDTKGTHFYMNKEEGCFMCFLCGEKGSFNAFRKKFGDESIAIPEGKKKIYRELDNSSVLVYSAKLFGLYKEHLNYLMNERKLTKETIEHFQLGSTGEKIVIPIFKNEKLVNIRYRRDPKDTESAKYVAEAHCKLELFNGDMLEKEAPKEIYLLEGELDTIMLWQQGYKNAIGATLGAGSFPDEWKERLRNIEKIYICFDNDNAGQEGALKVAQKLGIDRCVNILLPKVSGRAKTDITEFFAIDNKTKKDFEEIIRKNKNILHIGELADALREVILKGEVFGELTGYSQVDALVGGLRKGRLIILSGITSVGKSSFSNCIGLNFAVRGEAVLFFSLEMPPIDFAKKILMLKGLISNEMLKKIKDPSMELDLVDGILEEFKGTIKMKGLPIYVCAKTGEIDAKILYSVIQEGIKKFEIRLVVIDHLHYFAKSSNNITQETALVVRRIKQIALELDIPILLLAHLNRGGRTNQRKGMYIPNLSDLRDSGALEQDADQVLFVCRDSENEDKDERQKVILKIAKNRDGYAGRTVNMTFEEEIGYFEEQVGVSYAKEEEIKNKESRKEIEIEDIEF